AQEVRFRIGMLEGRNLPADDGRHRDLVPQAGPAADHILNANWRVERVHLRHELAEVVLRRDFPFVHQHGEADAGQRLGDYRDVKHGLRRVGGLVFQVGRAEALTVDDLAAMQDPHGTARAIPSIPLREEPIHPGREIGGEAGAWLVAEDGPADYPW